MSEHRYVGRITRGPRFPALCAAETDRDNPSQATCCCSSHMRMRLLGNRKDFPDPIQDEVTNYTIQDEVLPTNDANSLIACCQV